MARGPSDLGPFAFRHLDPVLGTGDVGFTVEERLVEAEDLGVFGRVVVRRLDQLVDRRGLSTGAGEWGLLVTRGTNVAQERISVLVLLVTRIVYCSLLRSRGCGR